MTPQPPTHLSVVIPALDEGGRLPESLDRIGAFLGDHKEILPAEIIVVDDGSTDDTTAVARSTHMPESVAVTVQRHRRNRGKGAAVRTGFTHSSGRWILLCDADLATPIEEVLVLFDACDKASVAVGSRAVDRDLIAVRQPLYRDLMGRSFNLLQQLLVLPGIADTQCGFKLFPGALGRALASVQKIDGFAYDVELLLISKLWGYRLKEVGIRWSHVEASRVQPVRHSAQMLRDLLSLAARRATKSLPRRPPELAPATDPQRP